jgi:hypothetical protein
MYGSLSKSNLAFSSDNMTGKGVGALCLLFVITNAMAYGYVFWTFGDLMAFILCRMHGEMKLYKTG